MKRLGITFFLLAIAVKTFGQNKNKQKIIPFGCIDYTFQQTHNFGIAIGAVKLFKRHTYIGILAGGNFVRSNKITYFTPNIFLDYLYQIKTKKSLIGPSCRLGYSPYKITGLKDNYLYVDVGFRITSVTIFAGYNYCTDTKDISTISNFRVGIRVP